jgi:hypothetical protein
MRSLGVESLSSRSSIEFATIRAFIVAFRSPPHASIAWSASGLQLRSFIDVGLLLGEEPG